MTAKIIQVGLGGWGSDWAETVLPLVEAARIVAFVEADPAARQRAAGVLDLRGVPIHASLEAAFDAVEADGVLAILPTTGHKAIAEAALKAGKHVLVEKPFTATIAEAREVIALAEAAGRIAMVSQNYRYHAATMTAADLVRRKSFGRALSASIEFRQDWKATGHRYHDIEAPLLLDMGIHHFDMLRMVLGENVRRVACHSWNTPYSPFKDHGAAHALLEMDSGLVASYHGSWLRRGVPTTWSGEWTIECEDGELIFSTRPGTVVPAGAGKLFLRRLDGKIEELATNPMHGTDRAGALDAFATAITAGRPPHFFPSAADNIGSLATSFACIRSSRQDGRWQSLSEILS